MDMTINEQLATMTIDVLGRVATVTLDHPPINLLDATMIGDLVRLEAALRLAPDVGVVIVRSADDAFFIAHADLEMIRAIPRKARPPSTELELLHPLFERWRTLPQVTIAEISGITRGGGSEFALSLDLRFAARDTAVLAQPEVALGLIPGAGGTQRLGRLAGRGRALEIILGGADLDADTASAFGWVNRAVAADELEPFVRALAQRIAAHPPDAVRRAKAAVDAAAPAFAPGLLSEQDHFFAIMRDPALDARFDAARAAGVQTRAGELDLLTTLGVPGLDVDHDRR